MVHGRYTQCSYSFCLTLGPQFCFLQNGQPAADLWVSFDFGPRSSVWGGKVVGRGARPPGSRGCHRPVPSSWPMRPPPRLPGMTRVVLLAKGPALSTPPPRPPCACLACGELDPHFTGGKMEAPREGEGYAPLPRPRAPAPRPLPLGSSVGPGEQREKPAEFLGGFGIGIPLLWSLGGESYSGIPRSPPPDLPLSPPLIPLYSQCIIWTPLPVLWQEPPR